MKKLLIFIVCIIFIGCRCGHKDGEHLQNDTICCVVDKKYKAIEYNVILQMTEFTYNVKFRNIETGNKVTINRKTYYDIFEQGDTIYEVVQHCPYYKVKFINK